MRCPGRGRAAWPRPADVYCRQSTRPGSSRARAPSTEPSSQANGVVVTTESRQLHLPRVQPRVLRQEVLGALRSGILANEIRPGSRLLEADIAARMSVSRAPVREAMRQLEQEGLIEFFPHRGAVVVGLPDDEIDTIYALRALIEESAFARACPRVTEVHLATLAALTVRMGEALVERDIDAIADVDLQFHGMVVELAGYRLLRHIWAGLDGLVRLRTYQALARPGRTSAYFLSGAVGSHVVLIEALRAGDPARAGEAAKRHVLEVPERLGFGSGPRTSAGRARDPARSSDTGSDRPGSAPPT